MFFIFSFILCLIATNPLILIISFVSGAVYDFKLQKKKTTAYILKFILPLILLITVFNGLFSHYGVTVLFVMQNGNNFTLEALVYGLISGIRIAGMLLWLDCFNEIITSEKIIFIFGRFSPRLALIISMVLRFIPLIRAQSSEISNAEKGIGNGVEVSGFIGKIRSASRRLSILVSWTLEKGIDTSDSMRARGYGLHGRTSYNDYVFSVKDALITVISFAALVLTFVSDRKLSASYNPIIDIPTPDAVSVILIIFFASVLLMPLMIDLWEEKRWSITK
ncbi:MAG: energy-coupling factor transporter transmembrane protein EcfT [Clostridia bacterium]|nr:energy-coupling factor transporter transmembrane protein EcfT [Clostridia bacterium]